MSWIDVSMPIAPGMPVWPGNPPVEVTRAVDGDALVSTLSLGTHTGTHVDAPSHYLPGGAPIEMMPLDTLLGPARVVKIDGDAVDAADLEALDPQPGERLLIRTRNSEEAARDRFDPSFVALTLAAARLLAARKIRCVGVDYLSVGGFHDDGAAIHRALLEAGVWILEGLRLAGVEPGAYELACLPLAIAGGDGAPARAVLRRIPTE